METLQTALVVAFSVAMVLVQLACVLGMIGLFLSIWWRIASPLFTDLKHALQRFKKTKVS